MGIVTKDPIYNCELCEQPLCGKMVILEIGYNWQFPLQLIFHESCFLELLVNQAKGWPQQKFQRPRKTIAYYDPSKLKYKLFVFRIRLAYWRMNFHWRIGLLRMHLRFLKHKVNKILRRDQNESKVN